ncbi:MAG: MerR family DNA-binding protein [Paludisphaera borealis]|uniref:MerR family transcriptional regulator n=1 Tax=Paludisphaera borealis TaxID=1387353 RepID=UPI0028524607|nr:MerR family DNA-binding protein [Paludisphaera borealis]MDR3619532.1 MerR family DNA-binding protein [Paludisphaera borealis]
MQKPSVAPGLTSGALAESAGVNVETLRFYERKGLLPTPPRRASGYREYPTEDVQRIRFIKRAQELGFSLVEIKELLALRVRPGATPADVKTRAEEKLADIRRKIASLKAMEKALKKLNETCSGHGPMAECPILHHLEGDL